MRMRRRNYVDNTRQAVWRSAQGDQYRVLDDQLRTHPFNDTVGEVWDAVSDLLWSIKLDIRRQLEAQQ